MTTCRRHQTDKGPPEISYTIRYPEYKLKGKEWVIRQTGIYHQYDTATHQSVWLLFNPNDQSQVQARAEESLRESQLEVEADPLWIHRLLFATYLPGWRHYLLSLESQLLPIKGLVETAFINETLRAGYDNLLALNTLQNRFLQIPTILASATEAIDGLGGTLPEISPGSAVSQELKNFRRQCATYSRNASHQQHRAEVTSRLLADTLSFREQVMTREQNKNIFQLNKSGVFLTSLGLIYLPSSFVSTFFGMNFFDLDQVNNRIVGTSMIWIFVVSSIILTAVTFLFYYGLLYRDGSFSRNLVPKVQIPQDWTFQTLKRQLTFTGGTETELEESRSQ
ncbi:Mg2+ transporter protein CorA-like/Zinc transport protein ZntB [Penicillium capsulatum]|nr:Mg2+ transporter protein CorA-like/Zinc transport protein ZntB [Penicillium capsulatum]